MASSKRSWEGHIVDSRSNNNSDKKKYQPNSSVMATEENNGGEQSSPIQSIFESFRSELDEHHDRREKIIKASRDITALSKKMFVSLFSSALLFSTPLYKDR